MDTNTTQRKIKLPGEILIDIGTSQQTIRGMVTIMEEGRSPEEVLEEARKTTRPDYDCFIMYAPSDDPTKPEKTRVLTITTSANQFSMGKTKPLARLFVPGLPGTVSAPEGLKYFGMVDHTWLYPVKIIDTVVNTVPGEKLSPAKERLAKSFTERLSKLIIGKPATFADVQVAALEVATDMEEMLYDPTEKANRQVPWGMKNLLTEIVDDPKGPKGAKCIRVRIDVIAAPTKIVFQDMSKKMRIEAHKWFTERMQQIFDAHPLIHQSHGEEAIPAMTRSENGVIPPVTYKLIAKKEGDTFSWLYPPHVPKVGGIVTDFIDGLVADKDMNRVPAPSPDEPMPIPAPVFDGFIKWFKARLRDEPGRYTAAISPSTDGTVVTFAPVREKPYRATLRKEFVDGIIYRFKVDLSEEKRLLDMGTSEWSENLMLAFEAHIRQKFRDAGWESEPQYPLNELSNMIELVPSTPMPLIKPEWVKIEGDALLPHINAAEEFKTIIQPKSEKSQKVEEDALLPPIDAMEKIKEMIQPKPKSSPTDPKKKKATEANKSPEKPKPMTRKELDQYVMELNTAYRNAGYLVLSMSASQIEEIDAKIVRLSVQVAKAGSITVVGDIPQASKDALAQGVNIAKGTVLNLNELEQRKNIAMQRLHLMSDGKTRYVAKDDGTVDVLIPALAADNKLEIQLGSQGENVVGGIKWSMHHKMRGTSEFSVNVNAGGHFMQDYSGEVSKRLIFGIGMSATTLPINAHGIYISGSLNAGAAPYSYRNGAGEVHESGMQDYVQTQMTLHIPLGDSGISSSLFLKPWINAGFLNRHGELADQQGTQVERTSTLVGEGVGIEYLESGQIVKDDILKASASAGFEHDLHEQRGDVTARGAMMYLLPLKNNFVIEAQTKAGKRFAAYGGDLPLERLLGQANIPGLDFGRTLLDPYASDWFAYFGAFLLYTKSEYIQPGVGVTVSSGINGHFTWGTGAVLLFPRFGLATCVGVDLYRRRFTAGLDIMNAFWEIY